MEASSFSRPALPRPHFSSTSNLSASAASPRGMQPLKEQDEVLEVKIVFCCVVNFVFGF